MDITERVKASVYMEWAKTKSGATYNLATSGLIPTSVQPLPQPMIKPETQSHW